MKYYITVLLLMMISSIALCQTISGTLRDKTTNEPLIGATVVIKGTSVGTTTDLDGRFTLTVSQPLQ